MTTKEKTIDVKLTENEVYQVAHILRHYKVMVEGIGDRERSEMASNLLHHFVIQHKK